VSAGPLKLKVCMLGATRAGKTSLVARLASGVFEERYLTTIGVQIQTRDLHVLGRDVRIVVWDLNGEDEFQSVQTTYVRGSAGYVFVVDGTRSATVTTARALSTRVHAAWSAPHVVAVNKADLVAETEVDSNLGGLEHGSGGIVRTSARTGEGVDDVFRLLVETILGGSAP